ncbi:DUF3109 family protein [Balneolales bacterium ANBcel1]|nr:DUF3109 family protein [Balneolales bacterium ANBcel1]
MFQVQHTIISDDVATFRFACDLLRCKGACCVVGDAGAPVTQNEIPVLNKAWRTLRDEMRPRARQVVDVHGLIRNRNRDPELNCTDGAECVFVTYDSNDVAVCGIQKAWQEGRFNWMKPLSCHLFPVRVMKVGNREYLNMEYVPSICSPACDRGAAKGIYLADFLKDALVRAYGEAWYEEFRVACEEVRQRIGVAV